MNSVPSLYSRGAKWLIPVLRSEQIHRFVGKETTQLFWQLPDQTKRPAKEEESGWLHPIHSDGRKEWASSEGQVKGLSPPPGVLLGGII